MLSVKRGRLSMQNNARRVLSIEETKSLYAQMERRLSSAAVYCVTPDDKLLIVKAYYKKHWSLPSGIIDKDETPLQAAVRETHEEVGIRLNASALKFISVIDRYSEEFGHTYQFVFTTRITKNQIESITLQPSEIDEYAFVSREEILSEDRNSGRWLGKAIYHWANNKNGYIEQSFSHNR